MSNSIVVGTQWGDEGKAKVVDWLTRRSDIIIRYHGGANAGHTVIVGDEKFVFHLVPSGIMYPDKVCIVGNGVVLDIEQFLSEVDDLRRKKISVDGRLFISDLAHLVLPYHKVLDASSESRMGDKKIGTTGRGIGPAYADKVSRTGLRVGDLRNWDRFTAHMKINFDLKKRIVELYDHPFELKFEEIVEQYKSFREQIEPFIIDTSEYLFGAVRQGKRLLFEGAQGTFLDVDHGTYPFVTSSNTIAGSACTGAGVGPTLINHVIGIVKAYTTRVGNGPFPTELDNETGEALRSLGGEFGATTGRPRRCGWFDSVLLRKAVQLNGITRLALTKLDVLNKQKEIQLCTHYEINGKKSENFPTNPRDFENAVPIYETMPGWQADLSGCAKMSDLPSPAQKYITRLKALCYDVPMLLISLGPERSQTIELEKL
ncbi:MAG: adenylosuccinate synthase [Chitinivibrionales bacterium]